MESVLSFSEVTKSPHPVQAVFSDRALMPCSRQSLEIGTPLSACFNISIICASLYRLFFIQNLLRYYAKKILLLNTTNFWGDCPPRDFQSVHSKLTISEFSIRNKPDNGFLIEQKIFRRCLCNTMRIDNSENSEKNRIKIYIFSIRDNRSVNLKTFFHLLFREWSIDC